MLVIFDVDGTMIGGEPNDWACFDQAISSVVGFAPTAAFFESLSEVTAQAITEAAIRAVNRELGTGLEELVRDEYLQRLRNVHLKDSRAFPARDGITALLAHLSSLPGVGVAIATGDWHTTISFKLVAAGLEVTNYPMATSSDVSRRSEIIRLAALRAKRPLSDAVYVGDAIWDMNACQELGVPFIGTGTKLDRLRKAGAQYLVEELEAISFVSTARKAIGARPTGSYSNI